MANAEAQVTPAAAPVPALAFSIRIPSWLLVVSLFGVALVLRLLLATIPGFDVDMGTFRAWSQDLANNDPWNFYQADKFTDYAPGYMYILWLIGEINKVLNFTPDQYEYVLKVPSVFADLASAYLVYRMLDKKGLLLQLAATAVYLFFPPALLVGAMWGQVDSILAFFLLLSVYFVSRDKPVAGAVAFAIGFLIKPQAVAALPFLIFWILRDHPATPDDRQRDTLLAGLVAVGVAIVFATNLLAAPSNAPTLGTSGAEDFFARRYSMLLAIVPTALAAGILLYRPDAPPGQLPFRRPPRLWLECAVVPLVVVIVLITPFFELRPWDLFDVLQNATNTPSYRVNSFWAYNFWNTGGIFDMGFHCDIDSACQPGDQATSFLGVDARYWSVFLFTTAIVTIISTLRNTRDTGFLALGTALSMLVFFLFLTRMHERYVFAFFLPFLVACALLQSRALWAVFVTASAVHFINLFHVFGYYYFFNPEYTGDYPEWLKWRTAYRWLEDSAAFNADFPLVGRLETLQIMSGLFVACFLIALPVTFFLAERRSPDTGEPEAT